MEIIRDDAFTIARMPGDMAPSPHLYLTNCVLSGPYYIENGRPAYLQADPESNILRIVGGHQGLALNFALGKDGPYMANKTIRHYGVTALRVPEDGANKSFWVWAQLEDDDRITFGLEDAALYKVTHSYKEPTNPNQGDYWFDMDANEMKRWNSQVPAWQPVRRIIIGKIGVGSDGNIYSMTSYPFRKDFAELHREYINFDGVSFVTGGQYAAENYEKWWQNVDVVENVVENYQAFKAMVFSDYVDGIFNRIFSYPGGLTKALGSPYADSLIWGAEPYETRENVLQQLFNNLTKTGTVTLPDSSQRPERYKNSKIISINREGSILLDLDFTDYKMLRLYAGRASSSGTNLQVKIGSTTLLNIDFPISDPWSERTLDISNYNGIQTLEIYNGMSGTVSYPLGVTGIILLRE